MGTGRWGGRARDGGPGSGPKPGGGGGRHTWTSGGKTYSYPWKLSSEGKKFHEASEKSLEEFSKKSPAEQAAQAKKYEGARAEPSNKIRSQRYGGTHSKIK